MILLETLPAGLNSQDSQEKPKFGCQERFVRSCAQRGSCQVCTERGCGNWWNELVQEAYMNAMKRALAPQKVCLVVSRLLTTGKVRGSIPSWSGKNYRDVTFPNLTSESDRPGMTFVRPWVWVRLGPWSPRANPPAYNRWSSSQGRRQWAQGPIA